MVRIALRSCWWMMVAVIAATAFAQGEGWGEEEENWKRPEKGHPGFFAAGGMFVQLYQPDFSVVNQEIKKMGIPELRETVPAIGGYGYGSYLKWRIGGFGFGGTSARSGTVSDVTVGGDTVSLTREAAVTMGGGGLFVGYRITLPKSFEVEPSAWIGLGRMAIYLRQFRNNADWSHIWSGYQHYASTNGADHMETTMSATFSYVQPTVAVRYYIQRWLAVAVSGQYIVPLAQPKSWRIGGNNVANGKSVDITSPGVSLIISFGV